MISVQSIIDRCRPSSCIVAAARPCVTAWPVVFEAGRLWLLFRVTLENAPHRFVDYGRRMYALRATTALATPNWGGTHQTSRFDLTFGGRLPLAGSLRKCSGVTPKHRHRQATPKKCVRTPK